jgi:integrase
MQRVRSVFKYALDADLIARPVKFGADFKRPSKKMLRLHKAAQGPKLFTAEEIRRLLNAAASQLRAMLLLGINGGFGNADCGNLPLSAVDLDKGLIDFPRPKTGLPRSVPLWPETVAALRQALAERPRPHQAEHADLFFVTRFGQPWAKLSADSTLSKEVAKHLKKLALHNRKGVGFYTLRHTFRTVADAAKDQPAADYIMGQEVPHRSSVYRERISDERLRAVTEHVRQWLWPTPADGAAQADTPNQDNQLEESKPVGE